MTPDALDLAWREFMLTFDRSRDLPDNERGKSALRAALRALAPDNLLEERARQIVAAVALKHGTTSEAIRSSSRAAVVAVAREEAAYELTRAGLAQRATARALGRKWGPIVADWLRRHEARVATADAQEQEANAHGR